MATVIYSLGRTSSAGRLPNAALRHKRRESSGMSGQGRNSPSPPFPAATISLILESRGGGGHDPQLKRAVSGGENSQLKRARGTGRGTRTPS